MTWRRFSVLLRGLSPNSATVTALRVGKVARAGDRVMRTPEAAQRAFEALFGPPRQTRPA